MPYKDLERRREAQRAATARWRARNPATAKQSERKSNKDRIHHYREWRSERAFRFSRGVSDIYKHLTLITQMELSHPSFVFQLNGRKRRETLHDPMPVW